MKNRIKEILEESVRNGSESEVYNIFEEGEFDPLGHVDEPTESDDLDELGVVLTKDCVLGFSNGNSKLEWPYLSLPAGYTCPFATVCKNFPAKWVGPVKGGKFKRPASWEKNVKPGPKTKFMCYAARAQGQYPGANIQAFKNLDLIKQFKTKEDIADLIIKSLKYHKIDDTDIFRIHEAGDFFSQAYFDAWIEVSRALPGTLFYAYTVSLPFWIARKGQIPNNFKLIASMDEENEQTILDSGVRYSKMVTSVEEASKLGLSIDVDDSIAWGSNKDFALLIHGPQPKGSEAAQALKRNKDAGLYGKDGKLNTAKQKNQSKKDELRSTIKRELRGESRIVEGDFDWTKETNPIQCKDLKGYYFYYGTDPRKFNIDDVSIKYPRSYGIGDEIRVLYKWYDQQTDKNEWGKMGCDTLIHRVKLGNYILYDTGDKEINSDDLTYTNNTFDDDEIKEVWEQNTINRSYSLVEDMKYWGVDGDKLGPLEEDDLDWASEGTDDGDGNHLISVMGKLEQMLNLKKSIEEDLKKVNNPIVKKLGIGKDWGGQPLPMVQNQILKLKKILEAQTTGFGKVDWQSIVVSREVGHGFVGENDYHLENYVDRMRDMGLEPNIKENHPYKVDPSELGSILGDYISGNLIWVLDVNPSDDTLSYSYSDQDGSYDTDVNLSSVKEVGEDYLKFGK